jgi:lysophospholipase L1-like esterase
MLGLPAAPRWAWLALALGATGFVVLFWGATNRTPSSPSTVTSADVPVVSEESSVEEDRGPARILVVGDGYTAASEDGGVGAANWAEVLGDRLTAQGEPVRPTVAAAVGSGYLQEGATGQTFEDLATQPTDIPYDVIVFFGSESDVADSTAVETAATAAFTRVREAWPEARLLVIGPAWRDGVPPVSVIEASAGVERAATAAGTTFVDPLEENWFGAGPGQLVSGDGYPTDEGHRMMADRIQPAVQAALDA